MSQRCGITVHVSLRYGTGSVKVRIPEDRLLGVLRPKPSVKRGQRVPAALSKPIASEPLPKLLDRKDKVAVVVSDVTRPCPTRRILPHVMRLLKTCGIRRDNVRILIATGMHRGHTPAERRRLLGRFAASISRVVDHRTDSVQHVGTTRRGTEVSVNPLLLDADFALAIGNVDVHYFAGYTGGYKAVIPGLAGKETTEKNHSLMILPNAEPGVIESNPVREDLEEAGQFTGLRYILNVVLDEANRIVAGFAGDPIAAHRQAARIVDDLVKVPIKENADIVVASAAGYPRDINLYQAHKAIEDRRHHNTIRRMSRRLRERGLSKVDHGCIRPRRNWEEAQQRVRAGRPQGLRYQQDRKKSRDCDRIRQDEGVKSRSLQNLQEPAAGA